MPSSIKGSDALLIQRLDTTPGATKPEFFAITMEKFSEFVALNSDDIIKDLSDQVDLNSAEIGSLMDNISVIVKDLTIVSRETYRNTVSIDNLTDRIVKTEEKVDNFETRAKVHLYYKWVEDVDPVDLEEGQMTVSFNSNTNKIDKVYYATIDADGTPIGQPYVFKNETLEMTSAYDASPDTLSKLRYRSTHKISTVPTVYATYVELSVVTLHQFSDGDYPFYEEDSQQPAMTRSDFYPVTADLDDLQSHVEDNYVQRNGAKHMFGNLRIQKSTPAVKLISGDQSEAHIDTDGASSLHMMFGNSRRIELGPNGIVLHDTVDAGNNEITNLGYPTEHNSAATKKFVEDAIDGIDYTQVGLEGVFVPGNQVAQLDSSSGVDKGGFYLINKTLYVMV